LLKVEKPNERCTVTTLPQGNLPEDKRILQTIVDANGRNLGVMCSVEKLRRRGRRFCLRVEICQIDRRKSLRRTRRLVQASGIRVAFKRPARGIGQEGKGSKERKFTESVEAS